MIDAYTKIVQCVPERVLPNPYQPRDREDLAHVAKIAESILQEGLLQVPVGRLAANQMVELAFGHTRLAAYRLLNRLALWGLSEGIDLTDFPGLALLLAKQVGGQLSDEEQTRWVYLPVNIRELGNDEMFRLGVSENLARKDLTALEEARAMVRYRTEFNKTSVQIGELFGYNESTVRNKMRLLDLPQRVLDGFTAGTLTEGAARELLRLFDLPESVLRAAGRASYHENLQPDYIVKCALAGELATSVKEKIDTLIDLYKEKLDNAKWKWDDAFEIEENGEVRTLPLCKGCAFHQVRDKQHICLDKGCYWDKSKAFNERYVQQAATTVGLPVVKTNGDSSYFYGGTTKALEMARTVECPNLGVVYAGYGASVEDGGLGEMGYPLAKIICTKRKGFCTCLKALEANVELRPTPPVAAPAQEDSNVVATESITQSAPITAGELQDVARLVRKQKKSNHAAAVELYERMALRLSIALGEKNEGIWLSVLNALSGYPVRGKGVTLTIDGILCEMGFELAKRIYNVESYDSDPAYILKRYNEALKAAGLPELSVSAETVEEERHV